MFVKSDKIESVIVINLNMWLCCCYDFDFVVVMEVEPFNPKNVCEK